MSLYKDNQVMKRIMSQAVKISNDYVAHGTNDVSRGWYICDETGVWNLHHDGIVRHGCCEDKSSAFWPTEESAREFYEAWKIPQGYVLLPIEPTVEEIEKFAACCYTRSDLGDHEIGDKMQEKYHQFDTTFGFKAARYMRLTEAFKR